MLANAPAAKPDIDSAPTWIDWLFPITLPWFCELTNKDKNVEQAGKQIANGRAVKNNVIHKALSNLGKIIININIPINITDIITSGLGLIYFDKNPIKNKFDKTIGTATHAINSDNFDTCILKVSTIYIG